MIDYKTKMQSGAVWAGVLTAVLGPLAAILGLTVTDVDIQQLSVGAAGLVALVGGLVGVARRIAATKVIASNPQEAVEKLAASNPQAASLISRPVASTTKSEDYGKRYRTGFGFLLLAGLLMTGNNAAYAQARCAPREQMHALLSLKYNETPKQYGVIESQNIVITLWTSETGTEGQPTFSLVGERSDGVSCLLAAGNEWHFEPPVVNPPETKSEKGT